MRRRRTLPPWRALSRHLWPLLRMGPNSAVRPPWPASSCSSWTSRTSHQVAACRAVRAESRRVQHNALLVRFKSQHRTGTHARERTREEHSRREPHEEQPASDPPSRTSVAHSRGQALPAARHRHHLRLLSVRGPRPALSHLLLSVHLALVQLGHEHPRLVSDVWRGSGAENRCR